MGTVISTYCGTFLFTRYSFWGNKSMESMVVCVCEFFCTPPSVILLISTDDRESLSHDESLARFHQEYELLFFLVGIKRTCTCE